MIAALWSYLVAPGVLLFLARVALASCLACGLGLLAVRVCRRGPALLHHALLLAALCLVLLAPALPWLGSALGWQGFPVHVVPESRTFAAEPTTSPTHTPAFLDLAASGPQHTELLPSAWQMAGAVLVLLWMVGSLARGVTLARALHRLVRFRRFLITPENGRLAWHLGNACEALGMRPDVPVRESALAPTPLSLGLIRPLVVLPRGLAPSLTDEQLRLVLRHEAAHIRRRDHWVAILQQLASVLYWWNPLLWMVNTRLARLREHICDDIAVGQTAGGRSYARLLLQVAEGYTGRPPVPCAALLDEGAKELEDRIVRLLGPDRSAVGQMSRPARVAVVLFTLLLSGLLLTCGLRAAPPPSTLPASNQRGGPDDPDPTKRNRGFSGEWIMSLPAGFQHRITLTPVGKGRYRLGPRKLNSSGVYEVRKDRLVIVQPNDRRLLGFEWELRKGSFVLVGQPPVGKTGSNYLGATLSRPGP
jgi:bla regulator protein blaR1